MPGERRGILGQALALLREEPGPEARSRHFVFHDGTTVVVQFAAITLPGEPSDVELVSVGFLGGACVSKEGLGSGFRYYGADHVHDEQRLARYLRVLQGTQPEVGVVTAQTIRQRPGGVHEGSTFPVSTIRSLDVLIGPLERGEIPDERTALSPT